MKKVNNKKIIFKVSNKVKNFLLISTICISILPFSGNIKEGDELGFSILCWGMATLGFILFLLFCKQVILQDEIFYVKNIFGRVHKYAFKDIVRADFKLNDGIVLLTFDEKNFKIDVQMNNFDWLLKELHEKKIPIFINGVEVED